MWKKNGRQNGYSANNAMSAYSFNLLLFCLILVHVDVSETLSLSNLTGLKVLILGSRTILQVTYVCIFYSIWNGFGFFFTSFLLNSFSYFYDISRAFRVRFLLLYLLFADFTFQFIRAFNLTQMHAQFLWNFKSDYVSVLYHQIRRFLDFNHQTTAFLLWCSWIMCVKNFLI